MLILKGALRRGNILHADNPLLNPGHLQLDIGNAYLKCWRTAESQCGLMLGACWFNSKIQYKAAASYICKEKFETKNRMLNPFHTYPALILIVSTVTFLSTVFHMDWLNPLMECRNLATPNAICYVCNRSYLLRSDEMPVEKYKVENLRLKSSRQGKG